MGLLISKISNYLDELGTSQWPSMIGDGQEHSHYNDLSLESLPC